jgi:hypothetical protein
VFCALLRGLRGSVQHFTAWLNLKGVEAFSLGEFEHWRKLQGSVGEPGCQPADIRISRSVQYDGVLNFHFARG